MTVDIVSFYNELRRKYFYKRVAKKKIISKPNFIEYYFFERRKIKVWNKKRNLIKFTLFDFKVSFSDDAKTKYNEIFLFGINQIGKFLKPILFNIWKERILSFREYNLIALLSELYLEMFELYNMSDLSNEFEKFEETFYFLISNERNLFDLFNALEKCFNFYREDFFQNDLNKIQDIMKAINTFFSPQTDVVSIYDIILAYNIVKTKRFINFNEIFEMGEDFVPSDFYDCSFDVFKSIYNQGKFYISRISILEKEITNRMWIEQYIKNIDEQRPKRIIFFYEKILCKNCKKDISDFFSLAIILFEGLIEKIIAVFTRKITLITEEEITISEVLTISNEFKEILNKVNESVKLTKEKFISVTPKKINFSEAINIYVSNLNLEAEQKLILESIYKVLNYFYDLIFQLHLFLTNQEIPKLKMLFIHPPEWKGKLFSTVITFFIELILEIVICFREKRVREELMKLKNFKKEKEELKNYLDSLYDKERLLEKFLAFDRRLNGTDERERR